MHGLRFLCTLCLCTLTGCAPGAVQRTPGATGETTSGKTPLPAGGRSQELVGETVADRFSPHYRFEKHYLDSPDGKRHYRIEIGIPAEPPGRAGYPIIYMLDGNAAMASLSDKELVALARSDDPVTDDPPVLVAVGYDIPTRNDVVSRAYDYTPPVHDAQGNLVARPTVRGRVGGGAAQFLRLIQSQVKPMVYARVRIDMQRETLWGHSYGGLFVLYTLFTQPQSFAHYVAGDPSLWWYDGALLQQWRRFDKERAAGKHVALLVGTKARDPGRPPPPSQQQGRQSMDGFNQRQLIRGMADTLHQHGAQVFWQEYPQYGHGEMLRASLIYALFCIPSQPVVAAFRGMCPDLPPESASMQGKAE